MTITLSSIDRVHMTITLTMTIDRVRDVLVTVSLYLSVTVTIDRVHMTITITICLV